MKKYSGEDIVVLPSLEAVRRRPQMYVGPLDSPSTLSQLVEQVLCASLDEAISGHCTRISVTLHQDDSVSVEDDGRGMPVDNDRNGDNFVEILMTQLRACRAMRNNPEAKDFCGLGMAVVNGLSETMRVEVRRDGRLWMQAYAAGRPLAPLADLGPSQITGLYFHFKPDTTIFQVRHFDADDLTTRLAEIRAETSITTRLELVDQR